ncbi:MAG TPA: flagellar basal body-associated FliL family protein [Candidatus Cloacimonadota bacterium]|jgi:flagellar basal body-associated protein FliL|nr:flagellar basal body-associated FliL family protein [Candidatus Cloacimonadales bacterium]HPY96338.1 flagellar basal body-associated FliL family protein [Candidatus Cloacimonadota bacterium]HQB40936.1 flagellar basal body-associated FliL family protein [Candidatus Cloacimonadota bacterium]
MMKNNFGKINMLVIIIIVVVQIIIAGVIYFFIASNGDQKIKPIKTEVESKELAIEQDNTGSNTNSKDYLKEYMVTELSDIVVNPRNSPESFLVVSIALEHQVKNVNLATELKNKDLLIKDKILTYFSFIEKEELQDIDNREKFKKDIKKEINSMLNEGKVTSVLISQFVIQ